MAQTTPPPCGVDANNVAIPHCVILTWMNSNTTPVVFHVYKTPGPCPTPWPAAAFTTVPPFVAIANTIGAQSLTMTTYIDSSISPGTVSYYVTADIAADIGPTGVSPMQSNPSDTCAQVTIPGTWPPTNIGITYR